jgi:hypothetical protein
MGGEGLKILRWARHFRLLMIVLVALVVALDISAWKLRPCWTAQRAQEGNEATGAPPSAPSCYSDFNGPPRKSDFQDYIHRLLTEPVTQFTLGLLMFAVISAGIYWNQLATTREIERAYIDISHVAPGLRPSQKGGFVLSVAMKNNGRTPGDILGGTVYITHVNQPGFQWAKLQPLAL